MDNDAGGCIEGISSLLVHNVVRRLQRTNQCEKQIQIQINQQCELIVGPAKVNWFKVADGRKALLVMWNGVFNYKMFELPHGKEELSCQEIAMREPV